MVNNCGPYFIRDHRSWSSSPLSSMHSPSRSLPLFFPHQPVFLDPCFQIKSFRSRPLFVCLVTRLKTGHFGRLSAEIAISCVLEWLNILLRFSKRFNLATAEMQDIYHHSVLNVFLTVLETVCQHLKACCRYIVLQVVEWEKSWWISENVVIERIVFESNEKWFTVWSTYTSVSLTVWRVLTMWLQFRPMDVSNWETLYCILAQPLCCAQVRRVYRR